MSSTLRHEGVIYPVFAPEDVAQTKYQMRKQAREGLGRVIRHVRLFQIYEDSLTATIAKAESIFTELAEGCDASVVEHEWGFYPISTPRMPIYDRLGTTDHLPNGFDLAAYTFTVPNLRKLRAGERRLVDTVINSHVKAEEWPKWRDANPQQIEGTINVTTGVESRILLDIEPILDVDRAGSNIL